MKLLPLKVTVTAALHAMLIVAGIVMAEGGMEKRDATAAYFEDPCPPGNAETRQAIEEFLTEERWADERAEVGISGIGANQVRLLIDSDDTAICQEMNASVVDRSTLSSMFEIAYYEAGDYYFVSYSFAPPDDSDDMTLGHVPLFVLDSELNLERIYFH